MEGNISKIEFTGRKTRMVSSGLVAAHETTTLGFEVPMALKEAPFNEGHGADLVPEGSWYLVFRGGGRFFVGARPMESAVTTHEKWENMFPPFDNHTPKYRFGTAVSPWQEKDIQ